MYATSTRHEYFILGVAAVLVLGLLVTFCTQGYGLLTAVVSGGAPLLDGVIFPPIFLGVGSAVYFRAFLGLRPSGVAVGIISLLVMTAAYFIAWRLGTSRKR